jgi:hypothetical protein
MVPVAKIRMPPEIVAGLLGAEALPSAMFGGNTLFGSVRESACAEGFIEWRKGW